jgi:hypothetical protein
MKKNVILSLMMLVGFKIHAQSIQFKADINMVGKNVDSFIGESKKLQGGFVEKKADGKNILEAENISVVVEDLKTGNETRDGHLYKKMESSKYPKIELLKAKASNGKGVCLIKIKDVKQKVPFTYKIENNKALVEMKISLSKFKFETISYMGVSVGDEILITGSIPKL